MTPNSDRPVPFSQLLERVQTLAQKVVRAAADDVDRVGRFPSEGLEALRKERLLAAAVPASLGGLGLDLVEIATLCQTLGQHCSATAMVFAMHQIQVACLVRHAGNSPFVARYLQEIVEQQPLIASATSEVGVGGDMRSSICAVERAGRGFKVEKNSSVISYGAQADAILGTSRRAADAPANDQVIWLVRKADYTVTPTTTWDTLGMRGTCSPGFTLKAEAPEEQIVPIPFGEVATQTMVPYAHTVWGSCWLGIATDAVNRARAFVRADARKRPGVVPFGAPRLAETVAALHSLRAAIAATARECTDLMAAPDGAERLGGIGMTIRLNNIKLLASEAAFDIVTQATTICGMAAYSNKSPYSMGRQLRDVLSARLMISNDRINATNAALLLVHKEDGP